MNVKFKDCYENDLNVTESKHLLPWKKNTKELENKGDNLLP